MINIVTQSLCNNEQYHVYFGTYFSSESIFRVTAVVQWLNGAELQIGR